MPEHIIVLEEWTCHVNGVRHRVAFNAELEVLVIQFQIESDPAIWIDCQNHAPIINEEEQCPTTD